VLAESEKLGVKDDGAAREAFHARFQRRALLVNESCACPRPRFSSPYCPWLRELGTALNEFMRFAQTLRSNEKSEAQTFLDHFFVRSVTGA
jgi:hypothetical protein